MGVSKNRGVSPKWMVYNGIPYQNGWFGGTTIFGNTHLWNHCKIATGTSLLRRSVCIHCQMTLPCESKVNVRLHRKSPLQTISIRFPEVKELLKMIIIFPFEIPTIKMTVRPSKIWPMECLSFGRFHLALDGTLNIYIYYMYIYSIHNIYISVPDLWKNARSWFFWAKKGSWRWSCQEKKPIQIVYVCEYVWYLNIRIPFTKKINCQKKRVSQIWIRCAPVHRFGVTAWQQWLLLST